MIYPEYVEVDGKRYKINTDYRVAIKCNSVAQDENIGDLERALAVIYLLFGEEGIDNIEHHEKLLELARKYLLCGEEYDVKGNEKPDMDFEKDYGLIWASMYSDYNGLDIDKENIHWWKFMDLMNGLSNSDMGNCCVLNRVRNLRNFDVSKISDSKEAQKIKEAQDRVALKKEVKLTKEQQESIKNIIKDLGIAKEG